MENESTPEANAILDMNHNKSEKKNIWERLPQETAKWFGRFEKFRLAGPGRSVEGVWKQEAKMGANGKQRQVPSGHWHRMAKEWQWVFRAEQWDAAQLEIEREKVAQERNEESRARRKLLREYRQLVEKAITKARPSPNWQDLTSALRVLCDQGRLEFGPDEAPSTPTDRGQILGAIILPELESLGP